jgi:NhaA family Na+:H+ antiporter
MSERKIRVRAIGRYLTPRGDEFVSVEALSGIVLVTAAVAAMLWANIDFASYMRFWTRELTVGSGSTEITLDYRHWINDALMAVFFFVVGLEIKRELVLGELRDRRTALVPALAAIGGMVVPALIYVACTIGTGAVRGWGVPMATDIALTMAVLALLGDAVPRSLRLFLLTLAIVDDIGAIVVIALFYSSGIELGWLAAAVVVVVVMVVLGRRVHTPLAYLLPALVLWYCVHESGVHATIAGVILGLLTPAGLVGGHAVLDQLEHFLHPASSFVVVPLFALANAGVVLSRDAMNDAVTSRVAWGIFAGLVAGKAIGVVGATALATRLRLGRLPAGMRAAHVAGAGVLAGIGFTVSLFIADLSFAGPRLDAAKVAVLVASLCAATLGAIVLRVSAGRSAEPAEHSG